MNKYSVRIKETNYGVAIIEAESKKQAEELVYDVYYNGNMHWTDSDISEIESFELESE